MNYIGSKHKLTPWIKQNIEDIVSDLHVKVFCDIFAGTASVAKSFKKDVKQVITNDMEHYSFVLSRNYIVNHRPIPNKEKIIEKLNTLKGVEGFVYKNYCLGSGSGRQYFSDENGKKIDAIRQKIQNYKEDENLYYFLLASLLESADKVANTASVYGAFLKDLKKTAQKKLVLEPALYEYNKNSHKAYNQDSNELIKHISGDILYLDPPYKQRQYGANYHILNTISTYKPFEPKGKTGIPPTYNRSKYARSKYALKELDELLNNARFEYIFLSYNNEGLIDKDEIKNIMQKYGDYQLVTKKHKRFRTSNTKKKTTTEYLHVLKKNLNKGNI